MSFPFPDAGVEISAWRGSGLFIMEMGVWRCLNDDKLNIVPRFFFNHSFYKTPIEGTHEAHIYSMLMGNLITSHHNYRVLCCFLLFLCSIQNVVWAEESNLVLHSANGEKVRIMLDEKPIVKFKDSKLLISSSLVDLEFEQGVILKATYELPHSSINSAKNDIIEFYYRDNIITITNVDNYMPFFLYSADGRLCFEGHSASNIISFSMEPYPSGAYIFKVNNNSYKLVKK